MYDIDEDLRFQINHEKLIDIFNLSTLEIDVIKQWKSLWYVRLRIHPSVNIIDSSHTN